MKNPVRPDEWTLIEPQLQGVRTMLELGEYGAPPRRCQFLVARKLHDTAFAYPGDDLLYRNMISTR